MNRGRPPQRKTPLKSGKPLRSRGRRQEGRIDYRTPPRDRARNEPSPDTRQQVVRRDRGRCQVCGAVTGQVQHRWPRGRGGHNRTSNLILMCGSGTTGCHGWAESRRAAAYNTGYLVRTGQDPAQVQVWTRDYGWVWLDDHGGRTPAPPLGDEPVPTDVPQPSR